MTSPLTGFGTATTTTPLNAAQPSQTWQQHCDSLYGPGDPRRYVCYLQAEPAAIAATAVGETQSWIIRGVKIVMGGALILIAVNLTFAEKTLPIVAQLAGPVSAVATGAAQRRAAAASEAASTEQTRQARITPEQQANEQARTQQIRINTVQRRHQSERQVEDRPLQKGPRGGIQPAMRDLEERKANEVRRRQEAEDVLSGIPPTSDLYKHARDHEDRVRLEYEQKQRGHGERAGMTFTQQQRQPETPEDIARRAQREAQYRRPGGIDATIEELRQSPAEGQGPPPQQPRGIRGRVGVMTPFVTPTRPVNYPAVTPGQMGRLAAMQPFGPGLTSRMRRMPRPEDAPGSITPFNDMPAQPTPMLEETVASTELAPPGYVPDMRAAFERGRQRGEIFQRIDEARAWRRALRGRPLSSLNDTERSQAAWLTGYDLAQAHINNDTRMEALMLEQWRMLERMDQADLIEAQKRVRARRETERRG